MTQVKIKPPPQHDIKVIPIAEEVLKQQNIKTFTSLFDGEKEYIVLNYYKIPKGDHGFRSLLWIATGKDIDPAEVWRIYKNSNFIYFVIAKERQKNEVTKQMELF